MYFKTRWYHYHKWHIRDVVSSWKVVYIIPHWEGSGGGGGGVLRISSDRDDRMGANISTHKNP